MNCVIFGGSGYIGTSLAKYLIQNKGFKNIIIADIKPSPLKYFNGVTYVNLDIRNPITLKLDFTPDWIFNFAAIHREPGHQAEEYYETNIKGAENVCEFAEKTECNNIYFTSSISVYGPTKTQTDEFKLTTPQTPYGISKLTAEYIHKNWLYKSSQNRRLVICRPGVIYGPGDPGNILRMIKAIKKGYFFLPGSGKIFKSYGYIYGLLESIDFVMGKNNNLVIYNYVEYPTEPLIGMLSTIKETLKYKAPIISLPLSLLVVSAKALYYLRKEKTPIHPVRVKKAGTSTHIIPQFLINEGFTFNYGLKNSLTHWNKISPEDF